MSLTHYQAVVTVTDAIMHVPESTKTTEFQVAVLAEDEADAKKLIQEFYGASGVLSKVVNGVNTLFRSSNRGIAGSLRTVKVENLAVVEEKAPVVLVPVPDTVKDDAGRIVHTHVGTDGTLVGDLTGTAASTATAKQSKAAEKKAAKAAKAAAAETAPATEAPATDAPVIEQEQTGQEQTGQEETKTDQPSTETGEETSGETPTES